MSHFPEIRNLKTSSNSPRQNLTNTPNSSIISFSNHSKNLVLDELVITKLNDKSKKEKLLKGKKSTEATSFKQKYLELIKFLKEREEYICQLEGRAGESEKVIDIKIPIKNQDQFVRKASIKNLNKHTEILTLKQENLDLSKAFKTISKQNSDLGLKISSLEQTKQRLKQKFETLEKNFQQKLIETETLQKKLKESELELANKIEELEDLARILRISEEKRKIAIEQTINTEKKIFNIKTKNYSIAHGQAELKMSLDDLTRELLSKESEIKNLHEEIFEYQKKLEKVDNSNSTLKTELEMVILTNKNNLAFWQAQLEEKDKQNKVLKENLSFKNQDPRKISKRSETVNGHKFMDQFSAQEIARWQQKYYETEEKLMAKNLDFEKMIKDGMYLSSQIDGKNLLIDRLNKIIQDSSMSETSGSQKLSSLYFEGFYEVQDQLEKLLKQNQALLESYQCSTCSSQQDLHTNHPCSHLQCSNCTQNLPDLCSFCSQKVHFSHQSPHSSNFLFHLKSQIPSFKHLKLLINTFSFYPVSYNHYGRQKKEVQKAASRRIRKTTKQGVGEL